MADLSSGAQTLTTRYTPEPGEGDTGLKRRKRRTVYARPVGAAVVHHPVVIDVRHLDWQRQAACLGMDTDLFFDTGTPLESVKPVCDSCPVQATCEQFANEHKLVGFWGAKTDDERRRDARERARSART